MILNIDYMNHYVKLLGLSLTLLSLLACNSGGVPASADMKDLEDSMAYSIGTTWAQQMQADGLDSLDSGILFRGFLDALEDNSQIDRQQMMAIFQNFQRERMAEMAQANQAKAEENQAKADAFLAENKEKEGVITTETGLQYKILSEGSGASPEATDVVRVHYTGKLLDGEVFDSSVERGEPAEFPVNGVISGWTEALQMMKTGGKWELYIPPQLGYGPRGSGQQIGPNEALIFEVELLEVK